ncbi:MAG: OmpP1/FadL family transporter [Caldilineaceae bacterium]
MDEVWPKYAPPAMWMTVVVAAISASTADLCSASGFRIPGLTVTGLSLSEALVANRDEVGALPYNPAAMSFHDEPSVSVGTIVVNPTSSATPDGGSGRVDANPDSPFVVPHLYAMIPVSERVAFGVNVVVPFGLETNWRNATFPAFSGPLAAFEPTKTALEMLNINPNVSYRLSENFSVAIGMDYYYVPDATSNSQGALLSGDGDSLTWNVALLYSLGSWTLGLSYLAPVNVQIDGSFDARSSLGFKVNTETELAFPGTLQVGARYQVSGNLGLEFDVDRTSWSKFQDIVVVSKDWIPGTGIEAGSELARTTNNWDDTYSFHAGGTYQLTNTVQLRGGYTFEQDPQPESYYSPRYPNAQRHIFNTGIKYATKRWQIEGALLYAKWKDRDVYNDAPYVGGDANGTTAFNGRYENSGLMAGISVSMFF